MPTTARLVAALLMAALGWLTAAFATPYLAEGTPVGLFAPISAATGAVIGWMWTGKKIQFANARPVGIGLAGVVITVFWVLVIFSGYEMIRRATRIYYDGPVDALQDMVSIAMGYVRDVAQPDVVLMVVLGGVLVGAATGWVARRYR